jgi:hypothetical protein
MIILRYSHLSYLGNRDTIKLKKRWQPFLSTTQFFGGGAVMFLNDRSNNLFAVFKALLCKVKLSPDTGNYLVVFVVTAIVLLDFLVTTFVLVWLEHH